MPRDARVVIPGVAHHVTQRGNNRQDVFFVDADREVFLQYLREAAQRFALGVEGYCLMTNHIHLVVTPAQEDSLATALKRVNQLYAQYVNRLHGRSGHVWQNRFFSCPLGSDRFVAKLETLLGRRLRPLPHGRPRKAVAKKVALDKGHRK